MCSTGADTDASQEMTIKDSRLVSKALISATNSSSPSFRVYYGVASGAVPFLWESQPGTPKHALPTTAPPPLTPPPSYYFNSPKNARGGKSLAKSNPRRGFVRAVLPRLALMRKPRTPPSVASSSGGSSWDEEENIDAGRMSPTSTLCFGDRLAFKKALLSVVTGRGSSA